MTKKILSMLLLLALAVGLYATAKGKGGAVDPTQTAQIMQPSQTATEAVQTCTVTTGINNGTVNLRSCAGTSCGVLDILTEDESLDIVTAGLWVKVTTEDGMTGWLNSKYCTKEK